MALSMVKEASLNDTLIRRKAPVKKDLCDSVPW